MVWSSAALLLLFQVVSSSKVFQVDGYLTAYASEATSKNSIEDYIQKVISSTQPDVAVTIKLKSDVPTNPTVGFVAELESADNLTRIDIIERLQFEGTIHLSSVTEIEPRFYEEKVAFSAPDGCLNDGFRLPSGNCSCKPITYGDQCQFVACQSTSIRSQDGSQCHCPPGYSGAEHCEQRGARPMVDVDFDFSRRTLIVVISMNPSYADTKKTIVANLQSTIDALQFNEPGYIDSYIGVLVAATSTGSALNSISTKNETEFIDHLTFNTINDANQTDGPQPILSAVLYALSQSDVMRSHPLVLVFTNREDDNPTKPSESIDDRSAESQLRQIASAWHAKMYFFIVVDLKYALNTSSNGYDAYRRVATASHGDLIAHDPNELTDIMTYFLPRLYKPEMTAVKSYVYEYKIQMDVSRDYGNQTVTLTVSLDWNQASNGTSSYVVYIENGNDSSDNRGPDVDDYVSNWKLFTVPATWTSLFIYTSAPVTSPATVSARMFVSSDATVVFSYSSNINMDNGIPGNIAEYGMYPHARAIGIGFASNSTLWEQRLHAQTSYPEYVQNKGSVRRGDWNMDHDFNPILNCTPGVYTQRFIIQPTSDHFISRVYPAYCFNSVFHPNQTPAPPTLQPQLASNASCYQQNVNVLEDLNIDEFRHIMYAVEISGQLRYTYVDIRNTIMSTVSRLEVAKLNRYYTLLLFDEHGAHATVNTYDVNEFVRVLTNELFVAQDRRGVQNYTYSMDAVTLATELILVSPAQLSVFSSAQPVETENHWVLPRNLQVNWYYVSDNLSVPPWFLMKMSEKQGGGSTIVVRPSEIASLSDLLLSSVKFRSLVGDSGFENCTTPQQSQFYVEPDVERLELTLTGTNVEVVDLLNGANEPINFGRSAFMFNTGSSIVASVYDTTALKGGLWTLTFKTTSGSCYCQARVVSNIRVSIGFSSDPNSDMVAQQLFFMRGDHTTPSYVMARQVSKDTRYSIDKVVVKEESLNEPWQKGLISNEARMIPRDSNSCSYQYRSDPINYPIYSFFRITVSGTYYQLKVQRVFFYYLAAISFCANGNPDFAGDCQCYPNYTGELCDQPICQNGGIHSNGVCDCADSGFTGTFCEYVVRDANDVVTVEPPHPATGATPATGNMPTTTITISGNSTTNEATSPFGETTSFGTTKANTQKTTQKTSQAFTIPSISSTQSPGASSPISPTGITISTPSTTSVTSKSTTNSASTLTSYTSTVSTVGTTVTATTTSSTRGSPGTTKPTDPPNSSKSASEIGVAALLATYVIIL